ncbi:MAG: hypothetical protein RLZZ126_118 [Pseudomonadota bacterium]|jgi:uncharacterized protein
MSMHEQALLINAAPGSMVGLLARPDKTAQVGVVIVVGAPQYRVGSHRQFVLLARRLAEAGCASLRFDPPGRGDSPGLPLDFEQLDDAIGAAIDALQAECQHLRRLVLLGLCDGASAALLYWQRTRDVRVNGLCLLNPWARGVETQAATQVRHYYTDRLLSAEFWSKLFRGGVAWRSSMAELGAALRKMRRGRREAASQDFRSLMYRALTDFEGRVALLLSGRDYTAKEFLEWLALQPGGDDVLASPQLARYDFPLADHTFSSAQWRGKVEDTVVRWCNERE